MARADSDIRIMKKTEIGPSLLVRENIPLAPFTLYAIGGPARFFVEVKSSDELIEALHFAKKENIPFFILGAGSNILVSDKGFAGLVIRVVGGEISVENNKVTATAGIMMARAVTEAVKNSLGGFEWAIGVPGTIGGSVRGNAGCFGGEIADVLESVEVFHTPTGEIKKFTRDECEFGYRTSFFKRHLEYVILSATLLLEKKNSDELRDSVKKISIERIAKQDIGTRSCGCIFKNIPWDRKDIHREVLLSSFPELARFKDTQNISSGFLIDSLSLKGTRIGKAKISERHANFFLNEGGARAEEVAMLISLVKDRVRRKYGILLEEEIHYVGF